MLGWLVVAACGSPPHASGHAAVPQFTINLDLAPADRFTALIPHFNASVWAFYNQYFAHDPVLRGALYHLTAKRGPEQDAEQQQEIEGMAKASGLPLEFVQGVQMIYELQTLMVPVVNFTHRLDLASEEDRSTPEEYRPLERLPWTGPGCTGIIAKAKDASGKQSVWHARNLDFSPVKAFGPLVYQGSFTRGGKEVFTAQMIAGYTMPITAARWDTSDGYSIERNTRYTTHHGGNGEMFKNLEGGRQLNGWTLRKTLETTPDYATAVSKIGSTPFVSTEYSIMSGVNKGTILARDPDRVAHVQTLGDSPAEKDYIIMTNFDWYWHDARENFDPTGGGGFFIHPTRRQAAQKLLDAAVAQGGLTPELLFETINAKYVLADTVFQAVINVEQRVWNGSKPIFGAVADTLIV